MMYNSEEYGYREDYFNDKAIRTGFIRKVYSILSVQLIITTGVAILFSSVDGLKGFAQQNTMLCVFVPLIAMPLTVIPLACSQDLRRRVPHNFILLGLFTLAESVSIGVLVSWSPDLALRAFIITAVIVFGLTLFAFQSKIDFTLMNGFLFCALLIFTAVGFILLFFPTSRMNTIYAGFGVLIFSLYLLMDTQMLIGGNHKYQISPEDYIFAALTIYLDIIQIFLYIMQLLSESNK